MAYFRKCSKCGNDFQVNYTTPESAKSPMCESCLEDELEKFPILPPRMRHRV